MYSEVSSWAALDEVQRASAKTNLVKNELRWPQSNQKCLKLARVLVINKPVEVKLSCGAVHDTAGEAAAS